MTARARRSEERGVRGARYSFAGSPTDLPWVSAHPPDATGVGGLRNYTATALQGATGGKRPTTESFVKRHFV